MRQVYRPGEKAFVDYAGPKFQVVDRSTGELRDAMVFVGVLGASNYTFVDVTWSRALPDWVMSHVRTYEFWGGVPELVIPDNEKAGVRKASRYEPDLNPIPGTGHALRHHRAAGAAPLSSVAGASNEISERRSSRPVEKKLVPEGAKP